MTNGHASPHNEATIDTQPTVVSVNFGLKARHLMMAFGGIGALVSSGAFAGWLVMPASKTEVNDIRQSVEILTKDMAQTREVMTKLTVAMDALSVRVDKTMQVKATRKPRAKPKSIWD